MNKNGLSIIIPQFNLSLMTMACIDYVINSIKFKNYEIILVDNGSTEQIQDSYKGKVRYIRSENNLMFSGGCNLGAKEATGNVLCFLNNDVMVKQGILECSAKLLFNENIGIVGPKLLYPNGRIQHAGVRVVGNERNGAIFDHIYRNQDSNLLQANVQKDYQSVTGACMFIRKEDFDKVEGFDIGYVNGYEDNDLCMKVIHNLGKRVIYLPCTEMIHLENQTPRDKSNTRNDANHNLFCDRWLGKLKIDA